MEQKVHYPGKWAYEQQVIRQHRKEVKNYLVTCKIYTGHQIAFIMGYYDKKIDRENILKVHTHQIDYFLYHLCNGKLQELYDQTSSRNFK